MAHFDMSNGSISVNGKTSTIHDQNSCVACGKVSYIKNFSTAQKTVPRDDWFPVKADLFTVTRLPITVTLEPPFPSIFGANILSNNFVIYSNSASNSFPVYQPADTNITFTSTSNSVIIDYVSPTSIQ